MVVNVTSSKELNSLVADNRIVMVDFWAEWCGPCRILSPILDKIAEEHSDKLVLAKVNVDDSQDLARDYGIMSIPTVITFKNGKVYGEPSIGVAGKAFYENILFNANTDKN